MAKGGDIKETVKSAAIGGGVGGAIPLAGATLRAVGKQVEQLPARFVNSALSRSKLHQPQPANDSSLRLGKPAESSYWRPFQENVRG